MKRLTLLSALCLSLCIAACGGDDDTLISEVTGTVIDGTQVSGFEQCGWLIEVNGTTYVPNVLNSQFQEDNLRVAMKVEFLEEDSNCSTANINPKRLRIEQIRRAN